MSDDPTQDAHSLGIALRLAHAQNRELRKQLATATEALDEILTLNPDDNITSADYWATFFGRCEGIAKQALAAIKPNQGKQPCTDGNAPHKRVSRQIKEQSRQQWKPIETAPKDGRDVLLYDLRGIIHIGSFRTDLNDEGGEPLWLANDHDDYSCGLASTPISANHWMPLPEPPMSDK